MDTILEYCDIIKAEKGITCRMEGLRCEKAEKHGDGEIHTIVLGFNTDKRMRIKEARAFFYEVVDGLLGHINNNEKVRPYFFHTPITYADLDVHLTFDFEHADSLKRGEVAAIYVDNNQISYHIVDYETPNKNRAVTQELNEYFADYFQKHRIITRHLPEKIKLN